MCSCHADCKVCIGKDCGGKAAKTASDNVRSIIRHLDVDERIAAKTPALVREHPSHDGALICSFDTAVRDVSKQYGDRPVLRYIGSDNSEDRHVSVLDQGKAIITKYYESNPVFVWAHQYGMPVIGSAVALDPQDKRTIFDIEFAVEEWDGTNNANLAKLVYRLAKSGRMPASSVGFIPLKSEEYEPEAGADSVPWYIMPVRYTSWELLELSSVPIPSNRSALKKALEEREVTDNEIDFLGLGKFMQGDRPYILSLPRAKMSPDAIAKVKEHGVRVIEKQPMSTTGTTTLPAESDDENEPTDPLDAWTDTRQAGQALLDAWNASDQADDDRETALDAFEVAEDTLNAAADVLTADNESEKSFSDAYRSRLVRFVSSFGTLRDARLFIDAWMKMTPEQRKGAVLSRKNRTSLEQAMELIDAVLLDADHGTEDEESTENNAVTTGNSNRSPDGGNDADAVSALERMRVRAEEIHGIVAAHTDAAKGSQSDGARADGEGETTDLTHAFSRMTNIAATILAFAKK